MDIKKDIPLKDYSTMRLGGKAAYLVEVHDRREVAEAALWADKQNLPIMIIGGGSNIVWRDEGFPGLILVNKIMGFEEQPEDDENVFITVGGGENWDEVVKRTVEKKLTGIEALSLIPGTAGATPVQNVGAYGQEIANSLVSVEAYDRTAKQMVTIPKIDCGFSYRTSRFKQGPDRGRFLITKITLHLIKGSPTPPFYPSLASYLDEHNIRQYSPQVIRDAVIAIRSSKLPDPSKVANNGSFFENPIIPEGQLTQLITNYPGIPHWPAGKGLVKISAAWLVEQAGFKGIHDDETGMATWPVHALVIVNERASSTEQLLKFRQKIIEAVAKRFGITLEQEPELLP